MQEISQEEPTRVNTRSLPAPRPLPTSLSPEEYEALAQHNAARHDWIEQEGAQDRRVTGRNYQRMADLQREHDRSGCHDDADQRRSGYGLSHALCGRWGQGRIIVAALVTPSEVMDNQPMLDLLWRTRFRWKLWPRQVTGDRKYGTEENLVAIEDQDIHAYIPLPDP